MSLLSKILREIESSPTPVSTPQLVVICACGLSNARARVWESLGRLVKAGLVKKSGTRTEGVYNRTTPGGTEVVARHKVATWEKA